MTPKIKWLIYAVSGLLLFGFGLSLLGEAIILKNTASAYWVPAGTLASGNQQWFMPLWTSNNH